MKPYLLTRAKVASELMRPIFGPSGVSLQRLARGAVDRPLKIFQLEITYRDSIQLEHPVDHQDRVAMRQALQDLVDVHRHGFFSSVLSSAFTRSRSACRLRSVAAFFSHDALSSNGNEPL